MDREKREALTAWARRVEEIVDGGPVGTVVEFYALGRTGRQEDASNGGGLLSRTHERHGGFTR